MLAPATAHPTDHHRPIQLDGPHDPRPATARLLAARIVAVSVDEEVEAVARELATARGMRVAFAVTPDGSDVGVLRMVHAGETTTLRRLAVVPAWEARDVAGMLADVMEAEAVTRGSRVIELAAAVERGEPQPWAQRGYRITARFPDRDRPLTQVTMRRSPTASATEVALPWEGDDVLPAAGVLITWFRLGMLVVATVDRYRGDLRPLVRKRCCGGPGRLRGADVWAAGGANEATALEEHLHAAGAYLYAGGFAFVRPPHEVAPFLLPRQIEPRVHALWRFARGGIDVAGATR